ncbi:hypothetical protein QBC47DRAFT_428850 [Echria macrotheca]|uniref:Uncharacterized protein n=1 Tax=Echria macrotheca TaxID=438768 RepID=A0AAJ0BQY5_9PEZI|nr:hypothetical protein QBC47DRAFT_428850 [Echria macrotheca]
MVRRKTKDATASQSNAESSSRPGRPSDAISVIISDDDEYEILPKRPVKRTRKTKRLRKPSLEDVEDGSGLGLQKPATTVEQHLMEQNKKSKDFIQTFKDEATKARDEARESLEQNRAHSTQRPDLVGSCSALDAEGATSRKYLPLFLQTKEMIRLCWAVVERHEAAERESLHPELVSPKEKWEKDRQKMTLLLEYGRQYGQKLAESLLSPEDMEPEELDCDAPLADEEDASGLALGMFDKTKKAVRSETWGQLAHAQMKALTSVARTLPGSKPDGQEVLEP